MIIITHRGLDPSKENYFLESSLEAFEDQLSRGFGLEFDLRFTKDNQIVILHDSNLGRISLGNDMRKICEIDIDEILSMEFNGCHITSFDNLLKLIDDKQSPSAISAIHLKHESQNKEKLDIILSYLNKATLSKFIIFDVTLDTAKYLKENSPELNLAPSVAHNFDIERYNSVVGNTLINIETILDNKNLFSWAWLDEWDKTDKNNGTKTLYNKETFDKLREANIKIALVTPELHATSPNLLGGEKHEDALNQDKLFARIKEIIELKPDALCTDYPDRVNDLYKQYNK